MGIELDLERINQEVESVRSQIAGLAWDGEATLAHLLALKMKWDSDRPGVQCVANVSEQGGFDLRCRMAAGFTPRYAVDDEQPELLKELSDKQRLYGDGFIGILFGIPVVVVRGARHTIEMAERRG